MRDAPIKSDQQNASGELERPANTDFHSQLPADAEMHRNKPQLKGRPRRRPNPLPARLLSDITHFARELRSQHGWLFTTDPKLKDRAAGYLRSQLPPWGKPGARGHDDVTTAIGLRRKLRRHYAHQYPNEKPHQIGKRVWKLICPKVIRDFDALDLTRQREARDDLRVRVLDRLNKRKRSALRKIIPAGSPSV